MRAFLLVFVSIFALFFDVYSQEKQSLSDSLINKVDNLRGDLDSLVEKTERRTFLINKLRRKNRKLDSYIDSLSALLSSNRSSIDSLKKYVHSHSQEFKKSFSKLSEGQDSVEQQLTEQTSRNRYFLIGGCGILLLVSIFAFLFSRKKRSRLEKELERKTREMTDQQTNLDQELLSRLEELSKSFPSNSGSGEKNPDHSFAISVANEITRIERNLQKVEDQKRIKALNKSVERLHRYLSEGGYQLRNLLGTEYKEGYNLEVLNFLEEDSLENNYPTISRVVKPQVEYKGAIVQRGQVDVSLPKQAG
ncbi:MAG: hypothetical protein ABEH43_01025 [Flavobacteriales bacterium]